MTSEVELAALLEEAGGWGAGGVVAGAGSGAEVWCARLAERAAVLDELTVRGVVAAGVGDGGGGGALLSALRAADGRAGKLAGEHSRLEAVAPPPVPAVTSHRGDRAARRLLQEMRALRDWLDAPELRGVERAHRAALGEKEGRGRARAAAEALRVALDTSGRPQALLRLGAVRARLDALRTARAQLAASVARHLNNTLIHLHNEAHTAALPPAPRHHDRLAPYGFFVSWLRDCGDRDTYDALLKVYCGGWARVYERELRAQLESVKEASGPEMDERLRAALSRVEAVCGAEEDFCGRWFALDENARRAATADLFPWLEAELAALPALLQRRDPYGAMRVLARVADRVTGDERGWVRGPLAAAALAAKRAADASVRDLVAALPERARQARRRAGRAGRDGGGPAAELERFCADVERLFAGGGRRADAERWCGALAEGALRAAEGCSGGARLLALHELLDALSAARVPSLEVRRREVRARYEAALREFVARLGRPLEEPARFFAGVQEALDRGAREDEVRFAAAHSRHELRRALAQPDRAELARRLRALYASAERELGAAGLLQVAWRTLQHELLRQHGELDARLHACYPAAGVSLPVSTADILDVFSEIARQH